MTDSSKPVPELLSPAGSIETFWAGFKAGADAFYLGTTDFNARRRAKNFTHDELRDTVRFSHRHGKKVYVTLNCLLFDRELHRVLDLLDFLEETEIDAVIIQDLGVLDLLHRFYPALKIHASTQLFCHNSLQARFLANQGVRRIVLPRELTLQEISTITTAVPLEYEIFVHGALCFSFSGCCLFSSHLFGVSGNRGECRQPCRFNFGDDNTNHRFPFSMKDLDTRSILPHILSRISVSALKIEGRLKNAAYVSETISAYRNLLDSIKEGTPAPCRKPGSPVFGRRSVTQGYFTGGEYNTLVNTHEPGSIGEIAGRVVSVRNGEVEIVTEKPLFKGDRLNLQTPGGKRLLGETLLDFSKKGSRMLWRPRNHGALSGIDPGQLVVIRTGAGVPEDPRSRMRKEGSLVKTVGVSLRVTGDLSTATVHLLVRFPESDIPEWKESVSLPSQPCPHRPPGSIERIFNETGETPFLLQSLALNWPDSYSVPLRMIKALRRELYSKLLSHVNEHFRISRQRRIEAILSELEGIRSAQHRTCPPTRITWRDQDSTGGCENGVVDITLRDPVHAPADSGIILLPPLFVSETLIEEWRKRIKELITQGYRRFMAPTYGWIPLLRESGAGQILAGPYLYAVNSFAVAFLEKAGVRLFALSPDLKTEDLGVLARYQAVVGQNNSRIELGITRLELPRREYHWKDTRFLVKRCEDYSVLYQEQPRPVKKEP